MTVCHSGKMKWFSYLISSFNRYWNCRHQSISQLKHNDGRNLSKSNRIEAKRREYLNAIDEDLLETSGEYIKWSKATAAFNLLFEFHSSSVSFLILSFHSPVLFLSPYQIEWIIFCIYIYFEFGRWNESMRERDTASKTKVWDRNRRNIYRVIIIILETNQFRIGMLSGQWMDWGARIRVRVHAQRNDIDPSLVILT